MLYNMVDGSDNVRDAVAIIAIGITKSGISRPN